MEREIQTFNLGDQSNGAQNGYLHKVKIQKEKKYYSMRESGESQATNRIVSDCNYLVCFPDPQVFN